VFVALDLKCPYSKDKLPPVQGGLGVIRKEAWRFYRTIFGVRLCWKLEEPEGPKGPLPSDKGKASSVLFVFPKSMDGIVVLPVLSCAKSLDSCTSTARQRPVLRTATEPEVYTP